MVYMPCQACRLRELKADQQQALKNRSSNRCSDTTRSHTSNQSCRR
jgi:hypothetical protein